MPLTKELLSRLRADYPDIVFVEGDDFKWSKDRCELMVNSRDGNDNYLLHELAHALLGHATFSLDIELLRQEREAWDMARAALAPRYSVVFSEDLAQDALDTYREWLHARTLCPSCRLTGLQTKTNTYVCVNCRCSWRPNDARRVSLRRYKLA